MEYHELVSGITKTKMACIAVLSSIFCAPLGPNAHVVTRNFLAKRSGGEPTTGDDDFPDIEPHPNDLDKVEGAVHDTAQLASNAIDYLTGSDNTIFLHYFNESDKDNVKKVFETILGTTTIPENPTFNRKGVTLINGAENPANNGEDAKFYTSCEELNANGYVSYLMNSLGATIFHEYLHYDTIIEPVFSQKIVHEDGKNGYGPVNIYTGGNFNRSKAITNTDSYTYLALEAI
ncbi:MAG: hypothetical protein Q9184_004308 [Pyrenodesmia sp. 2 TL-2023]